MRRSGWSRADAERWSRATCFSPGATDIVRLRERCIRGWVVPGLGHACALARGVRPAPRARPPPGHSLGITNCFVKISALIAKTRSPRRSLTFEYFNWRSSYKLKLADWDKTHFESSGLKAREGCKFPPLRNFLDCEFCQMIDFVYASIAEKIYSNWSSFCPVFQVPTKIFQFH